MATAGARPSRHGAVVQIFLNKITLTMSVECQFVDRVDVARWYLGRLSLQLLPFVSNKHLISLSVC